MEDGATGRHGDLAARRTPAGLLLLLLELLIPSGALQRQLQVGLLDAVVAHLEEPVARWATKGGLQRLHPHLQFGATTATALPQLSFPLLGLGSGIHGRRAPWTAGGLACGFRAPRRTAAQQRQPRAHSSRAARTASAVGARLDGGSVVVMFYLEVGRSWLPASSSSLHPCVAHHLHGRLPRHPPRLPLLLSPTRLSRKNPRREAGPWRPHEEEGLIEQWCS